MVALLEKPIRLDNPAERRMFPRKELHARVEAHRLDHTPPARRQPQLALELKDVSLGGLAAISDQPVLVGERMGVAFPARGLQPAWGASGRVLRCTPGPVGWRIALEFDPLIAA